MFKVAGFFSIQGPIISPRNQAKCLLVFIGGETCGVGVCARVELLQCECVHVCVCGVKVSLEGGEGVWVMARVLTSSIAVLSDGSASVERRYLSM